MKWTKTGLQIVVLGLLIVVLILASCSFGAIPISFGDVIRALTGQEVEHARVILDLRLPRILMALLSGAILTLGGFYMQALVKNPLADPYILGISTGAGFGVNLLFLGLLPFAVNAQLTLFLKPASAFLGAVLTLVLVLLLGHRARREGGTNLLLLAGIAVSALFMALNGLLIFLGTQNQGGALRKVVFWSFGSFNQYFSPAALWISLALLVLGLVFGMLMGNKLDVLLLGEDQASALGMEVNRLKIGLLLISALIVGGSIAFTGPIGFVGLMIPHFVRSWNGSRHRILLPVGVLFGAAYLGVCDLLSQFLHPWTGLPIGIVTAIAGVPFFLYLLLRRKKFFA